ncbi:MAG: DUF4215 domain-containing protein [Myxococcales bacterium]|nr:DUF4215 domain-containing protein [Myxococcales bacterium]
MPLGPRRARRVAMPTPVHRGLLTVGTLVLFAGCGRTDAVVDVPLDDEGTSFSYEDTVDTDTTDTTDIAEECGNGIVEGAEECDDGNGFDGDVCTNACVFAECGDGILWEGVEECDPGFGGVGPGEACVPGCFFAECGDGFLWVGVELCDDGNLIDGDGCNSDCAPGTCGDGNVDAGEQCDDQNASNEDSCLNSCLFNSCGDGFLNTGVEECDNGPLNSDSAACKLDCSANICGDGDVLVGDEECDDGNDVEDDLCDSSCVAASCGDGVTQVASGEECDDGNDDDSDDCTTQCLLPACGDGVVQNGEECDDGNDIDDDGCQSDCNRTRIVHVAMGGNHTCAQYDHGKLTCWGNGDDGRTGYASEDNLGDDELAHSKGFVDVGGTIQHVVAGISHTCAMLEAANNPIRCWGRPTDGQLGYGNTITIGDDELPSTAGFVDLGGVPTLIHSEGGAFHTCAVIESGDLICWGRENEGRLGYALGAFSEDVGDDETPAQHVAMFGPVLVGGTVEQLALGFAHTCALLDTGNVRCWGESNNGQLGYGNANDIGDDETPASAGNVPLGGTAKQIAGGWFHNCVILDTDEVKCWGKGNEGRLGYGNVAWVGLVNTPASVGVVDVGGTPVEIDGGNAHTCALLDDGTIRCWGWGARGQLGYGNATNVGDNETPASAGAVEIGGVATDIFVDGNHTCAVRADGRVLCWGDAGEGRLGYGNLNFIGDDELPASIGALPLF